MVILSSSARSKPIFCLVTSSLYSGFRRKFFICSALRTSPLVSCIRLDSWTFNPLPLAALLLGSSKSSASYKEITLSSSLDHTLDFALTAFTISAW